VGVHELRHKLSCRLSSPRVDRGAKAPTVFPDGLAVVAARIVVTADRLVALADGLYP